MESRGLSIVLDRSHFACSAVPDPGLARSSTRQRLGVGPCAGEPRSVFPTLPELELAFLCQPVQGLFDSGTAAGSALLCVACTYPAGAFSRGLDRRRLALGRSSQAAQVALGRPSASIAWLSDGLL